MYTTTRSTGQHLSVRQARYAAGILLAFSALWCAYWFLRARGYWEDDAWIHLEFARSFASGRGFSFNGLLVSGDSSPLWVVLLAAAHAFLPDWLSAGKLLAALGALFGLSGAYVFARRIARDLLPQSLAGVCPAALVLLIAAGPYTCYWLFSGMESVAAAGVACWAIVAATRERPTALSLLAACALAGFGPLLRLEMAALTLLLLPSLLRQWKLHASSAVAPLLLPACAMLLILPAGLWSLYSLHAFGHLLPSTLAAKRAGPGDSVTRRVAQVYALGLPLLLCGIVAVPAALLRIRRTRAQTSVRNTPAALSLPAAAGIFLLWTAATLAFYIAGHMYVQSRYALLTAPGLTAIVVVLALAAWPRSGLALYAAALVWSITLSAVIVRPYLRNKEINCRASAQMARFIRDRIPPDAPVATYSIGEIAFLSQHPIVDTGGITRPGALKYLNAPAAAVLHWAESEGAQYAIADSRSAPESGAVPVFTIEAPFVGWDLDPRRYSEVSPLSLWKLPSGPLQQASSSLPTPP